jgi:protoporphyrinogen IX oxidase
MPARKQWILPVVAIVAAAAVVAALAMWNPPSLYDWVRAVHVMAIISWMAGMLYLPRLFVYHCGAQIGSQQSETFKVMERRLLRGITTPAMIATWILGLWMIALRPEVWTSAHWLHVKLTLVAVLSGLHGMLARWTGDFAADRNRYSERFYRVVNEVPAVLMVGIVIMVVIKPF